MASGSFLLTRSRPSGSYIEGMVEWESEAYADINASEITSVRVYVRKGRTDGDIEIPTKGTWSHTVIVDGTEFSGELFVPVLTDWVLLGEYAMDRLIVHNSTGHKSIVISCSINAPSGTSFAGQTSTGSETIVLDVIPKPSFIGATDADIESVSSIIITQQSPEYSHSIKFKFGQLTGYIDAMGSVQTDEVVFDTTSVAFTLPAIFYQQIPDRPSDICYLTCVTYLDGETVGESQGTTFRVTASKERCAPDVTGDLYDVLDTTIQLTGDRYTLVRYCSEAEGTISAQAKNGASIVTKKIGGFEVSGDTRRIPNVEVGSFEFVATDSRGYSTSVLVQRSLVDYVKLTCNAQLTRDDPTSGNATLTVWGDYFNGNFGVRDNDISVGFSIAPSGGSYGAHQDVAVTLKGNTYKVEVPLSGLDYESAYSAQVVATDLINSISKVATVSQGIPVFDWGERDFRFNVALRLSPKSYGVTLPTENLEEGQIFFLQNAGGGFTIRIYSDYTWL